MLKDKEHSLNRFNLLGVKEFAYAQWSLLQSSWPFFHQNCLVALRFATPCSSRKGCHPLCPLQLIVNSQIQIAHERCQVCQVILQNCEWVARSCFVGTRCISACTHRSLRSWQHRSDIVCKPLWVFEFHSCTSASPTLTLKFPWTKLELMWLYLCPRCRQCCQIRSWLKSFLRVTRLILASHW